MGLAHLPSTATTAACALFNRAEEPRPAVRTRHCSRAAGLLRSGPAGRTRRRLPSLRPRRARCVRAALQRCSVDRPEPARLHRSAAPRARRAAPPVRKKRTLPAPHQLRHRSATEVAVDRCPGTRPAPSTDRSSCAISPDAVNALVVARSHVSPFASDRRNAGERRAGDRMPPTRTLCLKRRRGARPAAAWR